MSDDNNLQMIQDFFLLAKAEHDPEFGEALQEGVAREAERLGMTVSEYRGHMAKWAEFDRMQTEFMRAYGVEVRGMYQALSHAWAAKETQAKRREGWENSRNTKKAARAKAAEEAARIWDSLTNIPPHNRASVIALRMRVSEPTVRSYLIETGRKTKRR